MIIAASCIGCDGRDNPKPATQEDSQNLPAEPEVEAPRKLEPPPGEPGPVLVRLEKNFPTQIFGAAASESHIAIGLQADARDVTLCPETGLPVCFRGYGVITERLNPNQPQIVDLYEADTQSGNRIDDVAFSGGRFVFSLNEGRYVGDASRARLVIVDEKATIERVVELNQPGIHVSGAKLSSREDGGLVVCMSYESDEERPGVMCESMDMTSGKRTSITAIQTKKPVRTFDVSSSVDRSLVVWMDSGQMRAAFLDNMNEVLELGQSTAMQPYVVAGLDDFAVVWQGDDAQLRVDRIPQQAGMKSVERRTILLNGLDHRSIGGLVAVSEGYLFVFRHQNTQQAALISADFESWHLLENSESWRMMSDYASLDIQEAHTGKIVWQTAESLVGLK